MKKVVLSILLMSFIITSGVSPKEQFAPEDRNCGYSLKFTGLKCITPEGYYTNDAIYFKIDGTIWPSSQRLSMTSGSYYDLEGYVDYDFSGSVTIELWDDDAFDSDDFLGSVTVYCSYTSDGVARFTEDGVDYKLYYKVN